MNSSDTPPANRLCRLLGSSRSIWSRYFAVSPIHNLRITPPSGRTSCIPRSPDTAFVRLCRDLQDISSVAASRRTNVFSRARRIQVSNSYDYVVRCKKLARRSIEQHAYIPYTHGLYLRLFKDG